MRLFLSKKMHTLICVRSPYETPNCQWNPQGLFSIDLSSGLYLSFLTCQYMGTRDDIPHESIVGHFFPYAHKWKVKPPECNDRGILRSPTRYRFFFFFFFFSARMSCSIIRSREAAIRSRPFPWPTPSGPTGAFDGFSYAGLHSN